MAPFERRAIVLDRRFLTPEYPEIARTFAVHSGQ
jgi:hypothetical protein